MLLKRFLYVCLILSLALTACGSFAPKTVKVVVSLPFGLEFTKDMLNAAQLALDNAHGKAGNVTVEILSLTESEPNGDVISAALAQKNAEQAVKDPTVVALLGPLSSNNAKVEIPILNEASITQIASTTTWPGLTKPGYGPGEPGVYYPTGQRNFFRVVPSDELQGAAAARWATQLGYKSAYIIHGIGAYGEGVAGVFENTAKDLGITILGKDTYPITGEIPSEQLQAIIAHVKDAQPNMLYIGGATGENGEILVRALREADANLPIIGPDGIQVDDLIKYLNNTDLSNNIYATTIALPAEQLGTPAAAAFVSSYQAAYGKKPSAYDAATFEAMNVLLYAIGRAKQPTREGVLDAMQHLGDYSGIFGTWHFDEQGDISLVAISGMQIQQGKWVFVEALK